jgi:DNA-binding beta-propeller fold protein YncE
MALCGLRSSFGLQATIGSPTSRRSQVNDLADNFWQVIRTVRQHIPTGKAQGVAVDEAAEKYFVSVSKEQVLVIIDAKTLTKTGEVKLGDEADSITFDRKNHCAYVDHDHAPELWVVDPHTEKLTATVKLPGERLN